MSEIERADALKVCSGNWRSITSAIFCWPNHAARPVWNQDGGNRLPPDGRQNQTAESTHVDWAYFSNCYSREVSASRFCDENKRTSEGTTRDWFHQIQQFSQHKWLERPRTVTWNLRGACWGRIKKRGTRGLNFFFFQREYIFKLSYRKKKLTLEKKIILLEPLN